MSLNNLIIQRINTVITITESNSSPTEIFKEIGEMYGINMEDGPSISEKTIRYVINGKEYSLDTISYEDMTDEEYDIQVKIIDVLPLHEELVQLNNVCVAVIGGRDSLDVNFCDTIWEAFQQIVTDLDREYNYSVFAPPYPDDRFIFDSEEEFLCMSSNVDGYLDAYAIPLKNIQKSNDNEES